MTRTPTPPRDLREGDHVVIDYLNDDMRVVETIQRVDAVESLGRNRYSIVIGGEQRYAGSRVPYRVTDEPLTEMDREPPHASVVMLYGPTGTAYQRSYADGLWYATMGADAGQGITWTVLCSRPQDGSAPLVVHAAPVEG